MTEIKFVITDVAGNYAIELITLVNSPDHSGALEETGRVELQHGFASTKEAVDALVATLTFAPPDLEMYDIAVAKVGEIVDIITQLQADVQRIPTKEELEEAILALMPQGPRANPLLGGVARPVAPPPPAPAPAGRQPPQIRGSQTLGARTAGGLIRGGVRRAPGFDTDGDL